MESRKSLTLSDPLLKTQCMLGEGPVWDVKTGILHFLDIEGKKVYHFEPETSRVDTSNVGHRVGCLVLRRTGGLACAAERGFAILEPDGDKKFALKYLSQPLDDAVQPHTRFNDGGCDSRGRFFAGTLQNPRQSYGGELWCFDPETGKCELIDSDGITDSNGLGWSQDEKTFFFTNSLKYHIYAYDYDIETGKVSNRRTYIDTLAHGNARTVFPDGMCIDSEGGIWTALWGGSKVSRINTEGDCDFEILIPSVLRTTACCFGGHNLDQLYITTASCLLAEDLDEAQQEQSQYPDSGDLFVADLAGLYKGGKCRYEYPL